MPVFRLTSEPTFPPPHLATEDGLLAIGGDLSAERLLNAYAQGIFPWYSEGDPILWWSPDPRMVLFPEEFHLSKSMRRLQKQGVLKTTMDQNFEAVVEACATVRGPRNETTWITGDMQAAYCRLHEIGFAHSVECWEGGELVGGLYGVSLGACFFGESMFSYRSNASKMALACLVEQAKSWNFIFIDCQVSNPHLASLGAREIEREAFLGHLRHGLQIPTRQGRWSQRLCK